jgi:hypothetical protein
MNLQLKWGAWLLNTDFEFYDSTTNGDVYKSKKYSERKTIKEIYGIFLEEIKYDPHEASMVQCSLCKHTWVAVRPEGLEELECPNCHNICSFQNL